MHRLLDATWQWVCYFSGLYFSVCVSFCLSGVWLFRSLLTITSFLLLVLVILFPQPYVLISFLYVTISTPLYGNAYSESSARLPWPFFGPNVG